MRLMVRRAPRYARVLTCAVLALALSAVTAAKCFADGAGSDARMTCCAEMGQECDHASVQQGCCAVNAPDNGSPAVSSRIDHVKPQAVAVLAVNAVWQTPLRLQPALDSDAALTRLSRPTYLLISAFRI
jgi:hypothetical protein